MILQHVTEDLDDEDGVYIRFRIDVSLFNKDKKINVYKAVVLTILLYGAASWVIFRRHLRLIEHYHQRCLRPILNIHWSDFVTNTEVLEVATFTSIEIMPLKTQHRWAGRVSGIEEHRLSTITIYGELATGHRDRGTPRKRYKDTLKRSFATCKVDH
ncbi:hypothetical protein NP493_2660g00009, partial [Ridgeia piscesae]